MQNRPLWQSFQHYKKSFIWRKKSKFTIVVCNFIWWWREKKKKTISRITAWSTAWSTWTTAQHRTWFSSSQSVLVCVLSQKWWTELIQQSVVCIQYHSFFFCLFCFFVVVCFCWGFFFSSKNIRLIIDFKWTKVCLHMCPCHWRTVNCPKCKAGVRQQWWKLDAKKILNQQRFKFTSSLSWDIRLWYFSEEIFVKIQCEFCSTCLLPVYFTVFPFSEW